MPTTHPVHLDALAERFARGFAEVVAAPRKVGREAEFPLVDRRGLPGDVSRLWPVLADAGDPIFDLAHPDGELQVGIRAARWIATAEVGRGTVELSVGPADSLLDLAADLADGLDRVVAAAAEVGLRVLGYGIQPLAAPDRALMTGKRRYAALHEALGDRWLPFCVTASDQLHVEVSRSELIGLTNHLNAVSGAIIATCANSSVYAGRPGAFASGREGLSAFDGGERYRHGAVARPFRDLTDYLDVIIGLRCLCLPDGHGGFAQIGTTFREYLEATALADDERYAALLFHDHYVWSSARPRARLGTVEIRPACQQPPSESWAAAALALGLAESWPTVEALLDDRLGDAAWPALAQHREDAVRSGLQAALPFEGYLDVLVAAAFEALRERGLGEERLLQPVEERLRDGREPAAVARSLAVTGGVETLVDRLSYRPGDRP